MSVTTAETFDLTDAEWPCDVTPYDVDVQLNAQRAGQLYLWALTGRRLGVFTTTGERHRVSGSGAACGLVGRTTTLSTSTRAGIPLRNGPVRSVSELRIDDSVVTHGVYAGMVYRDDDYAWTSTATPVDVEVDYEWGITPDLQAIEAALVLGCEFLKGWNGEDCSLPSRAVSVSRAGISTKMQASTDWVAMGRTGISSVDAVVEAYNPHSLRQRSRVYAIDPIEF